MKTVRFSVLCVAVVLLLTGISSLSILQKTKTIEGSWQLVSFIDHANNSKVWQENPQHILYQKHINGTHFVWYKYDVKEDKMLGTGGGTYQMDNNGRYIENIEFFFPPGSSELGQAIPFNVEVKKGKWYHTGYAKRMEFNENGESIVTDSIKIEEIWEPLLSKTQNSDQLVGTWNLKSYRSNSSEPYQEYPEFTGYMKILTSTHFFWIKYNRDGDEIFAAGGGKYLFNSNSQYIEYLEMTYPKNSAAKGKTITFTTNLNQYKWIHQGNIPDIVDPNQSIIDEIWEPW